MKLMDAQVLHLQDMIILLNDECEALKRRYSFSETDDKHIVLVSSRKIIPLTFIYNLIELKANWHVDRDGRVRKYLFPENIMFKTHMLNSSNYKK